MALQLNRDLKMALQVSIIQIYEPTWRFCTTRNPWAAGRWWGVGGVVGFWVGGGGVVGVFWWQQ